MGALLERFRNRILDLLAGACFVSAGLIWLSQGLHWLEDGYWSPFPLAIITGRVSSLDMVGLQSLINWAVDLNLGIYFVVAGAFLNALKTDTD